MGIHSYPLHYGIGIEGALLENKQDLAAVKAAYPDKTIVFTELGWSTKARDEHKKYNASEVNQVRYIREVAQWFEEEKILGFIFEAFDEPWKGEAVDSCERNWGLFDEERKPKAVLKKQE